MGKLSRVIGILHQPRFNHFSLKAPLISDFESWKLLLGQESVDGESVHVQVCSDFLEG